MSKRTFFVCVCELVRRNHHLDVCVLAMGVLVLAHYVCFSVFWRIF